MKIIVHTDRLPKGVGYEAYFDQLKDPLEVIKKDEVGYTVKLTKLFIPTIFEHRFSKKYCTEVEENIVLDNENNALPLLPEEPEVLNIPVVIGKDYEARSILSKGEWKRLTIKGLTKYKRWLAQWKDGNPDEDYSVITKEMYELREI